MQHLQGKAARGFEAVTGEKVGRLSGLDPAGPRFIDGPISSAHKHRYKYNEKNGGGKSVRQLVCLYRY